MTGLEAKQIVRKQKNSLNKRERVGQRYVEAEVHKLGLLQNLLYNVCWNWLEKGRNPKKIGPRYGDFIVKKEHDATTDPVAQVVF